METAEDILRIYERVAAARPRCEAGLDPDACESCLEFEAGRWEAERALWAPSKARQTVRTLIAEVYRLRAIEAAAREVNLRFGYTPKEREAVRARGDNGSLFSGIVSLEEALGAKGSGADR